jgi:outer membrane protein OmpA-like peptidoglycan-associated protein
MQIAGELDIVVEFSNGPDAATQAILQAISQLKGEMRDMDMQIGNKNQQLVLLQGEAAEKKELAAQIKRQEDLKARIQKVESLFDRSEATVFRQGDTIVLRVIGLAFDSGKSTIDTSNFDLLAKVIEAINTFPRATIDVEGHTDSFGSDASNLTLSQARAESVRSYLLANLAMNPAAMRSFGFGESRPVANNETKEGRAKNRRIDLLIKPNIR